MKTIKELNSKWYWRFLKVAYSIWFIFILGISTVLYYNIFQVYNSEPLYQVIKKQITKDYWDYQNRERKSLDSLGSTISNEPFVEINADKVKKVNDFLRERWITAEDIIALAEEDWSDPEEILQIFRDNGVTVKWMPEAKIVELYKLSEKGYSYELLSEYNKHYNEYNTLSRDYRWIKEYLKIIWSVLWTFLWLIVLTFILKRILYYIILWEPFPKE